MINKKMCIFGMIFACCGVYLYGQPVSNEYEDVVDRQVSENKKQTDSLLLTLECIDFNRIAIRQAEYSNQLNRFSLFNKILYIAAGTALIGGGAFLYWRLNRPPSSDSADDRKGLLSKEDKDVWLARFALEKFKQEKEKATFLGAVKLGAKDAVKTSIYSFLMLLFYERFLHLGENFNLHVSQWIGKGPDELLKDNEEITKKVVHSFSEIINEYMHTCACVVNEPANLVAAEYKCFLENEFKRQHAVLMRVIEDLIAFFTAALEYKTKLKSFATEKKASLDNQVMSFVRFTDNYAHDFQLFLNTHDETERTAQEAQINLLNRELFLRIARFMQKGAELLA